MNACKLNSNFHRDSMQQRKRRINEKSKEKTKQEYNASDKWFSFKKIYDVVMIRISDKWAK